MSKYIDSEKVAQELLSITYLYDNDYQKGYYDGIDRTLKAMSDTPVADVAPVRRGKWIEDDNGTPRCSKCHKRIEWQYVDGVSVYGMDMPYCPNCGTDMRKELP